MDFNEIIAWISLLLTLVALFQTGYIYSLEARYNRPALEINHVRLDALEISRIKEDGRLRLRGLEVRQREGVREADRQAWDFWLDLEIVLALANGIAVKNMEIISVTFSFPNSDSEEKYTLRLSKTGSAVCTRSFERRIVKDCAMYILRWSINPFTFKVLGEKNAFENAFYQFLYYRESRDSRYLRMNLDVNFRMRYEYGREKGKKCTMVAAFMAEQGTGGKGHKNDEGLVDDMGAAKDTGASDEGVTSGRNRHIISARTSNGYVTYKA